MDDVLNQCSDYLFGQGDRAEDLVAKRASLRLKEARLGEASRDIPVALGGLGLTLSEMGQAHFAEAREKLDRAVALDEKHRPESADMAHRYLQRAQHEIRRAEAGVTADLDAAADWIGKARALFETHVGAKSDEVANCWNTLGYLHDLQGRGAEAAEYFERALNIRRALPNPNPNFLAGSAMNTGASWLEAGDPARAEGLLRKAQEILADIFRDRPDSEARRESAAWLIACLYTLARAGDAPADRRAEAEALCRQYRFDPTEREANARRYPTMPQDAP